MYPHYICIVLYVILIGCNDIAEIYCQFGGLDVSSVYMHLANMKLIWCNAILYIYFQLQWGDYISSVYVHSAIYKSYLV